MCTCSGNHPWGTERARGGHPRPRLSPAQAPRPPRPLGGRGAVASATLSLNSSSAWKLFFSHSTVTLPPSSMVMVP